MKKSRRKLKKKLISEEEHRIRLKDGDIEAIVVASDFYLSSNAHSDQRIRSRLEEVISRLSYVRSGRPRNPIH